MLAGDVSGLVAHEEPHRLGDVVGLADAVEGNHLLEVGKRADVTVIDLRAPHLSPAGPDLHATLVYGASKSDVTDVLVGGSVVVRDRRLLTLDAAKFAASAEGEARRVLARARP